MSWLLSLVTPMLVPLLTPVLMEAAKKAGVFFRKEMPANYVPALAAALGAILEALIATNAIPGLPTGISGPLLGLTGVGVRELINQLHQKGLAPSRPVM